MELEKCTGGPSSCGQSSASSVDESPKDRKKGGSRGETGEANALSEPNDGESRGGKSRGYGKQRIGVGSSVELTGGDMEVSASNDQQCEFGEWGLLRIKIKSVLLNLGAWNTCRGSCKSVSLPSTKYYSIHSGNKIKNSCMQTQKC
jgi:hypothetical protein